MPTFPPAHPKTHKSNPHRPPTAGKDVPSRLVHHLTRLLRDATVFTAPDGSCLSPAGEYNLRLGILKEFEPHMVATASSKCALDSPLAHAAPCCHKYSPFRCMLEHSHPAPCNAPNQTSHPELWGSSLSFVTPSELVAFGFVSEGGTQYEAQRRFVWGAE